MDTNNENQENVVLTPEENNINPDVENNIHVNNDNVASTSENVIETNNITEEVINNSDNVVENSEVVNILPEPSKKKLDFKLVVIAILLIAIMGSGFYLYKITKKDIDVDRVKTITNLSKNDNLRFVINDKEYYIGDSVSKFLDDGYTIDNSHLNNDFIEADSILVKTFYYNNKAMFSGSLYCQDKNGCKYKDTILIKANFYSDSKVVVNDKLSFKTMKSDLENLIGKENGKFYQDQSLSVWTNGNKVGDYYYVLRCDTGGLFSLGYISDLRIGIWWYEGEMEHTVVEEVIDNEE